jgi:molybdopterin-dependent oxidoreductase alpha subunit
MAIDRSRWVSLSPNGLGHQKPNHYGDMVKVALSNRKHPVKAWKILSKGVCDGCALGVSGFHDWTLEGVHLCTTRLNLLKLNTADAMDHSLLGDVVALRAKSSTELRDLGRLAYPMRRRKGDKGFRRIGWDEAMNDIATAIRATTPERVAMYLTSRGITNETYYVAGKAARAIGVNSIDSAARTCHAPSSVGLKDTIGVAASTCSMQDVLESDLIVLWGANVANNQPVFTKYLYLATKRGAKIVVINPYLEPGLDRYWVPSNVESALFGTKLCDLHVPVRPGGDVALANLVLRRLIELNIDAPGTVDRAFIDAHTDNWAALEAQLLAGDVDQWYRQSGLDGAQVEAFVDLYANARASVLVWSMGITQHTDAVAGVRSIVNVALARGNVGRDGAGLMPIRGHSGVQGGAEMGAYATALPGMRSVNADNAAELSALWGFEVPSTPGLTAAEQVEAAEHGELDVLWVDGGNFMEVLPQPARVQKALERMALRVHSDIVVTSQMLVDGDDVILLPVATRYEQEGGGTSTTTERRIAFSPEIVRPPGQAKSEWRMWADLAIRVKPELSSAFAWPSNEALRHEIAKVVPSYAGIELLNDARDQVQYGGRHLCADGQFDTPNGRGQFTINNVEPPALGDGEFFVSTRRGKQFNSMVMAATDPLTGARRDAVYIDSADAARLGLGEGSPVRLVSRDGAVNGHLKVVRLPVGSLQVHWPEGNALLPSGAAHRDADSKVPDYNAVVTIEALEKPARR